MCNQLEMGSGGQWESLITASVAPSKEKGNVEGYYSFTFSDSRSHLWAGRLPDGRQRPCSSFCNCPGTVPQWTLLPEILLTALAACPALQSPPPPPYLGVLGSISGSLLTLHMTFPL